MKIKLKNGKLTINLKNDFMFLGEGEPQLTVVDKDDVIKDVEIKNYIGDKDDVEIIVDGEQFTVKSILIPVEPNYDGGWNDIVIETFEAEPKLLNILMIKGFGQEPVEIGYVGDNIVYTVMMMSSSCDKNNIIIKVLNVDFDVIDF